MKNKKTPIKNTSGILYVIATPIGNLGDMTFRSIDILKSLDMLLCEDTRTTKKLLSHYGISVPLASYNSHSTGPKLDFIIDKISKGEKIGLVSDAGTPTISDPGVHLVKNIKEKLGDSIQIIPIPGASAVVSALSASGMNASEFLFLGFLPHKKGRETLFKEILASDRTAVFYESPHRILKALDVLSNILEPNRKVAFAREITKIFEEIKSGTAKDIRDYVVSDPDSQKGEFVVMVEGKK
jgi:16S rRNA (cytidine1402-2'-O)-methyltransferase